MELPGARGAVIGLCERSDDYCATAYVYCREPQPVPRIDLAAARADLERRPYEAAPAAEAFFAPRAPTSSA